MWVGSRSLQCVPFFSFSSHPLSCFSFIVHLLFFVVRICLRLWCHFLLSFLKHLGQWSTSPLSYFLIFPHPSQVTENNNQLWCCLLSHIYSTFIVSSLPPWQCCDSENNCLYLFSMSSTPTCTTISTFYSCPLLSNVLLAWRTITFSSMLSLRQPLNWLHLNLEICLLS